MSGDVSMYDEELKDLEDQLEECARAIETMGGDDRNAKVSRAQDLLRQHNRTFHQFRVEIRMLDDAEKSIYEKKAQAHTNAVNALKPRLQKKAEVQYSPASPSNAEPGQQDDGKGEARRIKGNVENIQRAALASLARSEKTVAETEEIGDDAAQMLRGQTEQIRGINEKLDHLDSQVNRAKKELNAFVRRMMTDKILLCFGLMVIIGIIIIIVMKIKDSGDKDAPPPVPSPPKLEDSYTAPQGHRYGRYLF